MASVRRQLSLSARWKQVGLLMGFVAAVAVGLLFLVPNVWVPAWQAGGVAHGVFAVVVGPIPVINHAVVYATLIGLFLGTSALWVVDDYKRTFSFVLWVGITIGAIRFWQSWTNPLASPVWVSVVCVALGAVVGTQAGGLPVYGYVVGEKKALLKWTEPNKFEAGIRLTSAGVVVLVLVGLAEQLQGTANPGGLIEHAVAVVLIAVPLLAVQRYQDSERIIQLGPAKSGKTSTQGGLYMSLDSRIESNSPLLQRIHESHMRNGEFPDRTRVHTLAESEASTIPLANGAGDDPQDGSGADQSIEEALLLRFSYLTNGLLFPKEKVITAVDYPGELLTDVGEQESSISDYVRAHVEKVESGEIEDLSWEEVIERLQQGGEDDLVTGELEEREVMSYIAHLVRSADYIMFTIPLDDFLGTLVADRPENLPSYHRNTIWEIRPLDDADADYQTRQLGSDGEWEMLTESGGTCRAVEGQLPPGFNPNKDAWLGGEDVYYYRGRRERIPPQRYLNEYRDILDALPDLREYHFIWMATMADLVYDDFETLVRRARGYALAPSVRGESIDVTDGRIEVGRSDIDVGLLAEGLLESNRPVTPESSEDEYRLFSTWIRREYLRAEEPNFDDLLEQTNESHVFPVWFDIQDDTEQRFSTRAPALKGTAQITARLRGDIFKNEYSGGVRETLGSAFGSTSPVPDTMMVYQLFEALRDEEPPAEK